MSPSYSSFHGIRLLSHARHLHPLWLLFSSAAPMLPLSGAAGATYSKTICFCNNSTLAPDPSTPPSTGLPRHSHPPPFLQCSAPPCVVPPFCSVPNRISLVWSRLPSNPPPLTAQVLSISVHSSTNEFSRHLVQRMWWSLYLLRCNSVRVPAIIQPAITSVPGNRLTTGTMPDLQDCNIGTPS